MKRNEYAEPTEMAGIAEAETEMAYAWALDYDDATSSRRQRLTPRRITTIGIAASLILIAVAGVVMLIVLTPISLPHKHLRPLLSRQPCIQRPRADSTIDFIATGSERPGAQFRQ